MKAKISCMFQGGMAIEDYYFKEWEMTTLGGKEWLKITEDDNRFSYINLDYVNMFSLREVMDESDISN